MKNFFHCFAIGSLIVSAAANAQGTVPARKLVAEFRIDGETEQLNNIMAILPQSKGDVVVIQEDEMFGRLYSGTGLLKKKFLRSGSGPGEARAAFTSGMIGDTIWLFDEALRRYTLLRSNGELLRSWPQQPIGPWQDGSPERKLLTYVAPRALLPNGVAIGQVGAAASATASGEVTTYPIVRMNWEGVVRGVINHNPRAARSMMVRVGSTISYGQQPFDIAPEFGLSPDGRHIVIADMKTPGREPFIYLTHISIRGDTLLRVKVPFIPDPITARTIDSAVSARTRTRPEIAAQYRAALYIAPYWPPVITVLVANDGTTWLQMHTNNGARQWTVVSPKGVVTMKIDIPKSIRLMRIDRGIWGTELDENDVPSVVRYKLGA